MRDGCGQPEREGILSPVAREPDSAAARIGALLAGDGQTLAVAESLTGGELSARFGAHRAPATGTSVRWSPTPPR